MDLVLTIIPQIRIMHPSNLLLITFLLSTCIANAAANHDGWPVRDQDGFVLVDASIVYTSDSGRFSIGAHAKNLFDKEYIVAGYNFVAGGTPPGTPFTPTLGLEGTLTGFYGDPQRFYVTTEFNF